MQKLCASQVLLQQYPALHVFDDPGTVVMFALSVAGAFDSGNRDGIDLLFLARVLHCYGGQRTRDALSRALLRPSSQGLSLRDVKCLLRSKPGVVAASTGGLARARQEPQQLACSLLLRNRISAAGGVTTIVGMFHAAFFLTALLFGHGARIAEQGTVEAAESHKHQVAELESVDAAESQEHLDEAMQRACQRLDEALQRRRRTASSGLHRQIAAEIDEDRWAKPDFSGKWKLTAVEGDVEGMMQQAGVGWFKRKAARMANFGVDRVDIDLKQEGDEFTVTSETPVGSSTVHFTVGAGEQKGKASDGGAYVISPVWGCSGTVREVSARLKREDKTTNLRRFLREGQMVIESELNGVVSREVCTKQ